MTESVTDKRTGRTDGQAHSLTDRPMTNHTIPILTAFQLVAPVLTVVRVVTLG